MKFKEYLPLALVTNRADATSLENRLHCGMGCVTEVGELVDAYKRHIFYKKDLDLVNLTEEVGDVLWYVAVGVQGLGISPDRIEDTEAYSMNREVNEYNQKFHTDRDIILGMLTQYASGTLLHAGGSDEQQQDALLGMYTTLVRFCRFSNIDINESRRVNIEKLKKRYPDGFTTHAALNRDLTGEREVLENTK